MSDTRRPPSDAVELDPQDIFKKIAKHRLIIGLAVCLSAAAAVVYSYQITPIYKASSRLLVDGQPPKILKVENVVLPDYDDSTNFFNSQIEILKSRTIAELVLNELGSYEPIDRRGKPAGKLKPISDTERAEALQKRVKIVPVRMTEIIAVTVEDSDPKLAAHIADLWTRAYMYFSSVDQLVQRRSELRSDLNKQLEVYKAKHPVILSLQNQIAEVEEKITREQKRLASKDTAGISSVGAKGEITNVKILDRAEIPIKPVSPRKAVNVALGIIFGLVVGLGIVFFLESFDQTIKTVQEIDQVLYLSCLVAIPYYKDRHKHLPARISAQVLYSGIAESFRSLRTGILFSNPDYAKKTFVMTSSSPFEGKSTVAVNLATVFAQAGERTILVDTDMRKPTLHTIFGVERGKGITDILVSGSQDLAPFIRKTETPGLDLITCGSIPPNPSELLGSQKMEKVISQLLTMYDRIIFDTPPVLAATDAVVLSTKVDSTILVVRSGFTHRQAALRSKQALNSVHAHILGVVLNMVKLDAHGPDSYNYFYEAEITKKAAQKKTVDGLQRTADFFLFFALVAAPLMYGSVFFSTQIFLAFLSLLTFYFMMAARSWAIKPVLGSPLVWLGGGILVYSLLQLIPLPLTILQIISPATYAVYTSNIATGLTSKCLLPLSVSPEDTIRGIMQFMTYGLTFLSVRMRLVRDSHMEEETFRGSLKRAQYLKLACLIGVCAILFHSLYDFNLHITANGMFFVFLLALATGATHNRYDHAFFHKSIKFIVGFGFFMAVFAIIQKLNYNGKIFWVGMDAPSPVGSYYNYDHFAGFMQMCGAVAVGMFVGACVHSFGRTPRDVLIYGLMAVIMVATIVMSTSRGGIMSFVLSQIIFFFLVLKAAGRRSTVVKIILFMLTTVALSAVFVVWLGTEDFLRRFNLLSIQNILGMEGPINPRLLFYKDTWEVIKDFPIFGTGFNTFAESFTQYRTFDYTPNFLRYAHNDYLQLVSEAGVAGIAFILLFWWLFIVYMGRVEKRLK